MTVAPPRSSLCMIVRDSARTLPACLASVRPWVDEMIVVDTGSVDDTRQIALECGARLYEFPWIDDFSAARNESLRHAQGEWLFWMDSDDTIDEVNGQGLRALVDGPHSDNTLGYVLQVHCPGDEDGDMTVVDHVKLIRNRSGLRFEGRIHEQVLQSIRRLGGEVGWTDLFVVHSGADQSAEAKERKYERDLRILQLDLLDRPDHPFVLFNLGMTYEEMGEYAVAEQWLRRCIAASAPSESHVRKAYALLVSSIQQQKRTDEAVQCCQLGLALFPHDAELRFHEGILAYEQRRFEDAIGSYRKVIANTEARHFSSMDRGIAGHKTRYNLAVAYTDDADLQLAELQFRLALDERPRFSPARRGLGQSLLAQNKLKALDLLVEEQQHDSSAQADNYWLAALLAERRSQTDVVACRLRQALSLSPNHLPAHQDYCRWLFHHGTLAEAEAAMRELIARWPDNAAAYHNLGIVLSRQNRLRDAVDALQQSIQLRPDSAATRNELHRLEAIVASQSAGPLKGDPQKSVRAESNGNGALPDCYARRAISGETRRFHCLHPKVHIRDQIVTPAICGICTRWQEPRPESLRPDSDLVRIDRGLHCRFIGSEIGLRPCPTCRGTVNLKLFSCSHPSHMETTLHECRLCADYIESNVRTEQAIADSLIN